MSSFGGGGNFISSGTNQLGVTARAPLTTGLKRIHSETSSSSIAPPPKLSRSGSTSGGLQEESGSSTATDRERVLQLVSADVWKLYARHRRHLAEVFFLDHNGSLFDFESWLSSSPPEVAEYLQAHAFRITEVLNAQPSASSPSASVWSSSAESSTERHGSMPTATDLKSPARIGHGTAIAEAAGRRPTSEREHQSMIVATSAATGPSNLVTESNLFLETSASGPASNAGVLPVITLATPSSVSQSSVPITAPAQSPSIQTTRSILEAHLASRPSGTPGRPPGVQTHRGPGRPPGKKNASNVVNGSRYKAAITDGRIEHAAKQEVAVLHRIADLRREGLWSADKLPKCADPPRSKTHWDYLLEEMKWLAIDFEQERRWKKTKARKLAAVVVRQKKEEEEKHKRAELDREKELRRIAAFAAKEIRQFWNDVEKVVEYKSESILEAKRKRALDKHLDFIVGQTEKFSSLVQSGLVRASTSSVPPSEAAPEDRGDSDFEAEESSEDDESTIDKEEKHVNKDEVDEEVAMLQQECEMDLDDILDSLPPGYLEAQASEAGPSRSADATPEDDNGSESSEESDQENDRGSTSQTEQLPEDVDFSKLRSDNSDVRQQELTHFAETAEKLQPKGYTLETTTVVTKVPFLLKHQLREYQHVGLDWLVTLYDRKLNGILADEMGLGKTIQTIALLAHLACDKGNWGPHLIVVPTTVMLNWEMEFKKWCPGFKILTYYGSVKERKEKRHGWSKPNAFHVCITSYKLVLQDHLVFRRKKWEYLILDEAQNIKNFKSQRWQMLLHFNAQRRLLLTGTPLQNSLMELWSLMHFLMPEIFASHRDFKDWFSNPVTDMIEGSREYNEQTVRRLHKVLRPFLLRRLKSEVEKQLPKKYEHIVPCALSKRQRYLYDDFMSRGSTKDQLSTGNVMSVLNVLMQLRKVCNHPNLFETRPIMSPFIMERLTLKLPALVNRTTRDQPADKEVPNFLLLQRCRRDVCIRCRQLAPDRRLIEDLSDDPAADSVEPPAVPGFKFVPLKAPLTSAARATDAASKKKNFQFVIPAPVAKDLDFNQPFLVQIQAPAGPKLVPIQLRPPPPEALAKIGLESKASSSSVAPSTSGSSNTPVQLPVYRLSQPSQLGTTTLQPASTGTGIRASPSRLAIVTRGAGSEQGARPAFAVALVKQPGSQVRLGLNVGDAAVRSRTVLWRPAAGIQAGTASGILRPHITVQEARARTPPTVRYVDPSKTGVSSLPSSKPSTPVASPAVVPSSPNIYASAASLLPSPGESAGSEADASERTSPAAAVDPSDKLASSASGSAAIGTKRSGSSDIGLEPVAKRRSMEHRQQVLQAMATENERRNLVEPLYGSELVEILATARGECPIILRKTITELTTELEPVFSRFCIYTPAVLSGLPRSTCSSNSFVSELESVWPELNTPFKPIINSQMLHFPELRLIEYDCGKLQTLNRLLRNLQEGGHRCLIFTQMTKMLDILEAFLSYMGLKYLRMDGATRIEHRQVLMERFNQDSRIFCLILSTRSGGLGVNLTGADTVIFYDSDWNPTMDAQAQDRCHRIGQTRDVHIYRLISEKTVEENILKKAAQKRRLGEVAIEEGSFTTEFFKKGNLKEIFDLSDDVAVRVDEAELSQQELEQQMAKLEDDNDVQATRCARAETMAELSEFDESQLTGGDEDADPDVLEVENKMRQLMSQLKPVERYAVKYLETLYEPDRLDELQQTEEQIQQRKQQWELANQERLEQEQQQRKREEDEEFDLTFNYDDSLAQMFCPAEPMESMPIWMPPTPPLSDSEFEPYVDTALGYLYSLEPMEESDLPPISGDLDLFRTSSKSEPMAPTVPPAPITRPPSTTVSDIPAAVAETVANIRNSFNKTPKEGQPRSLFEGGASPYKAKRDVRRPVTPPSPGFAEQESTEFPEWGVLEDYALLQAVTKGQQMAYTLASAHPGHVANWDYVSKWVSAMVGRYCSPRACHNRYQFVILPREEGRMMTIDPLTKKSRKVPLPHQEMGSVKKFRMRTGQQFQQEGASFMATRLEQRFSAVRKAMVKRASISRERGLGLANCLPATVVTRRRHDAHLQALGFSSDKLLSPGQLAEMRDERLKEMKKQQHMLQQQQQQQQQAAAAGFHSQPQQPVQMPYQPPMQPAVQQQLQPVHGLPQYPQAGPQGQSMMETQHPMAVRPTGPMPGGFGISSTPGTPHQQQQMQVPMPQQQGQQSADGSQIAVSIHPAGRLMPSAHHVRQAPGTIASSQAVSTGGTNITHMLAAGTPRPQGIGVQGVGARSTLTAPAGVTTATVYRQVSASGGLIRAQRTPPSTPAPAGLHPGTSIQVTPGAVHPRASMAQSVPISGTAIESSATPLIGPVLLQTPPAGVRFQAVSSVGGRQKIQFGTGGGFLVSADNKPTVLSVPPMASGASIGGSASHQSVTPISITGASAARATAVTPRHQVQLSQGGISAGGKKNFQLPRIATITQGSNRGAPSPVHLVASQVGGRITATQTVHGVRAPSPSPLIRGPAGNVPGGRNIPSISMIMPPVARLETIQSTAAGVTVSTVPSSAMQTQHSIIVTTSVGTAPSSMAMISPQGAQPTSQGQAYGASSNRGQQ